MRKEIEITTSQSNKNYLALMLDREDIISFLDRLKFIIGDQAYQIYTDNQRKRDNDRYHITIISPAETISLGIEMLQQYKGKVVEFQSIGIGKVETNGNSTYYIVVESAQLNRIRQELELEKRDFHITMGFSDKDLHDMKKNRSTLI